MPYKRKHRISRIILTVFSFALLTSILAVSACKKNKPVKAPSNLTREEAALYMALASVCPPGANNTKAEYLTFRIEGWSFNDIPETINEYIADYSKSGNSVLMQMDDAGLEKMGLIKNGDGDYYKNDEKVYAEGKGKIFTFILGEDQDINSDNVKVSVKSFKSERDTSGFDVELKFENGEWHYVTISGVWNYYQLNETESDSKNDPQK